MSLFSPSELNDIDSEDEEDTTKDYDSDEDLQVGISFTRITRMTTQWPIQREKPWSVAIICQFESKIIICHRTIQSTKFYLQIDEDEAGGSGGKKERYFWQYNVQAKGPKGQVILQNISMLCFSLLGPIKLFILVSFRNSLWTRQSTIRTS